MNEEILLPRGNVSGDIVRVGDTVRRPAGPWTPSVHAFLEHLHGAGFAHAPRPLGFDERGREVLTFAEGTVPWGDDLPLLAGDGTLRAVARVIRDLHDAAAGFVPPDDAVWNTLVPPDRTELITHNDLAPWNLVAGERLTFIDWDGTAPGSRLWDLAYAAHGFLPLARWSGWDHGRRLGVFADAYGADEAMREALVPLLARRTRAMHDFLREQAGLGVEPWLTHWRTGHGDAWRDDTAYIEEHDSVWRRALGLS
ncbi:phosphotransferase [Catenuloplanes indicus]|uniref:Aminoglycoside phosphotransferase (APT) family kinase protein n=1 Tax=Catenuloplanes indicus TaxID=137267 RepID=A0AAE4B160_9ACTN|nr:phosphotransferase [Catenuloplanes indicus]MDQ0370309.1 aminoglycoside phosphotransferase (APT) family kinase protein [Catenuloplanes indicus]